MNEFLETINPKTLYKECYQINDNDTKGIGVYHSNNSYYIGIYKDKSFIPFAKTVDIYGKWELLSSLYRYEIYKGEVNINTHKRILSKILVMNDTPIIDLVLNKYKALLCIIL